MKIIHLSDLHLGKRLNDFPMIEDQKYILTKIINVIDDEKPQAVIIAGDIYDKSIPPAEAVQLFDDFVCRLAQRDLQVFVISGNHDSAERIAFGSRLMDMSGVHMSRVYDGNVSPVVLEDEYGAVNFYMLPFVKPINVRAAFKTEGLATYTEAVSYAVDQMKINTAERNVLITHQFVTGASRSDSEEISVGGTDNVDASSFGGFDYVALGHIHGPQNIGSERIRYCGTPLKYSFSEKDQEKSVTVVELGANGGAAGGASPEGGASPMCEILVRTVALEPQHDMREIRGKYEEVISRKFYEGTATDDYLRVILTDEEDIVDGLTRLRTVYPNIMKLEYDNLRTRSASRVEGRADAEELTPNQLFAALFETQNGKAMDDEQEALVNQLIEDIWEGGNETC